MAMLWLYYGYVIAMPYDYVMAMLWLCYGYVMAMLCYGYTMATLWLLYGYVMSHSIAKTYYFGYKTAILCIHQLNIVKAWLRHSTLEILKGVYWLDT